MEEDLQRWRSALSFHYVFSTERSQFAVRELLTHMLSDQRCRLIIITDSLRPEILHEGGNKHKTAAKFTLEGKIMWNLNIISGCFALCSAQKVTTTLLIVIQQAQNYLNIHLLDAVNTICMLKIQISGEGCMDYTHSNDVVLNSAQ